LVVCDEDAQDVERMGNGRREGIEAVEVVCKLEIVLVNLRCLDTVVPLGRYESAYYGIIRMARRI